MPSIVSPVVPSHKIKLVNQTSRPDAAPQVEARAKKPITKQSKPGSNQPDIPRFESKLSSVSNELESDLIEVTSNMQTLLVQNS